MSKYNNLMKFLDKNSFITADEARGLGISPMMLSRMAASGEIYRIEHGIYAKELGWLTDPLKKYIVACARYPKAVICGISALTYYDLTDEEERQIWIAMPPPKTINNARYRVIRPNGRAYSLGVERHAFGRRIVKIYDIEKTIVDAFKYNTEEIALKALKGYLKRKDRDVLKLCEYARKLKKPLDDIITVLMADG